MNDFEYKNYYVRLPIKMDAQDLEFWREAGRRARELEAALLFDQMEVVVASNKVWYKPWTWWNEPTLEWRRKK